MDAIKAYHDRLEFFQDATILTNGPLDKPGGISSTTIELENIQVRREGHKLILEEKKLVPYIRGGKDTMIKTIQDLYYFNQFGFGNSASLSRSKHSDIYPIREFTLNQIFLWLEEGYIITVRIPSRKDYISWSEFSRYDSLQQNYRHGGYIRRKTEFNLYLVSVMTRALPVFYTQLFMLLDEQDLQLIIPRRQRLLKLEDSLVRFYPKDLSRIVLMYV